MMSNLNQFQFVALALHHEQLKFLKGQKGKRQVSESEADEAAISTATDKRGKRRKQNSGTQDSPNTFKLMMNYFDKRFEGIERK